MAFPTRDRLSNKNVKKRNNTARCCCVTASGETLFSRLDVNLLRTGGTPVVLLTIRQGNNRLEGAPLAGQGKLGPGGASKTPDQVAKHVSANSLCCRTNAWQAKPGAEM